MSSILRKAMLPAAVAIAMIGFIGAFGAGSVPSAHAIDGDICLVDVGGPGGQLDLQDDPDLGGGGFDGQGNDVYVVEPGVTYGLVFRVEENNPFDMPNVEIRVDSETGSARITSKAEITDIQNGFEIIEVDHVIGLNTGTVVADTIDPDTDTDEPQYFTDPDGNPVDGINGWIEDVAGMPGFTTDALDACGINDGDNDVDSDEEDLWGFIDFECIESGYFHIDVLTPDDTEEEGWTDKFYCTGQAESATIAVSPATVETDPVGSSKGESTVTVTVEDQFGDRIDGIYVTLTTDNCTFKADGSSFISPAGGGKTVDVKSDTDTGTPDTKDEQFLIDNPLEHSAGTAEAILDCDGPGPKGTPGTAHITAVVQRPGSDIVLSATVTVVGSTSTSGLTLTLSPDDVECGETITATATAVDSTGANVSDGTLIYFTTDTSSGIVGGSEGAQGGIATVGGKASVLIATDPSNPGTHTVIAYAIKGYGDYDIVAQTSATYTCDAAVAPAAPTVAPPATGTGTGSITPPSTGDAGLASGTSSASLFVIAGAVAFVLAGLASVRFARN